MTKLEKARQQYPDMPDCPYLPMGKVCLVYRIPAEEKTAGGLFIPEAHSGPKPYGVLVAAGLKARDILADALIEIGDVVHFGQFEGSEGEFERENAKKGKYLLQLKVDGILGSVDALSRLKNYRVSIVDTDDGPQHQYVKKEAA